nr:BAF_HP1_G0036190.mRNA.1.CDS.1 [Saccharomyces cerevisiae]
MGEILELTNKNFMSHLKKDITSQESLKSRIEDKNGDVASPKEDNYPLLNETAAWPDEVITSEERCSSSGEKEDSGLCSEESSEEDPEEAEEESARAFGELVAVLRDKDIPLNVLDEPQMKDWLEKYTGVYRSSWHG